MLGSSTESDIGSMNDEEQLWVEKRQAVSLHTSRLMMKMVQSDS